MPGEIVTVGAAGLKAAHVDRDHAIERLRAAAAEGRLTSEELDERVEAALTARTFGQLAALTADLPESDDGVAVIRQVTGKVRREGAWEVPAVMDLRPAWCDVTLDFTQARIVHPTLHLALDMKGGALRLITRPGVVVDATALTLQFAKTKLRPDASPSPADLREPLLRIRLTGALHFGKVVVRPARRFGR
ncbi:protein of unknown function [Streptacidiphilus jiangxiensis]|uniref:DUF1707 domain-containing protein n=2 Tax=Streptacidiphilus jiangxiensis TaxID=235985 RepID=A0A1H7UWP3_STRJI|nr:protein of unknown function [Streptacidiphilus jiangxiensis]